MNKKTTEILDENELKQFININSVHSQNLGLIQTNKKNIYLL